MNAKKLMEKQDICLDLAYLPQNIYSLLQWLTDVHKLFNTPSG